MAGLLDIFGTSGAQTMGLLGMSPEDVQRNRDEAQAQALFALAGRLFQGGKGGASIVEGLQQGQQAYRQAMQGSLQQQLQNAQIQEMVRKRKEDDAKREQEKQMRLLTPQIFTTTTTPEQVTYEGMPSQFPALDDEGNLMPNMAIKPAQTTRSIDTNKLQALAMMSPDPLAALANMSKLVPDLRKAGFVGGTKQEDNPFLQFTTDPTIPKHLQTLASQYATSFSKGLIDPDKADQRAKELTEAIGRSQQFQQSQASLDAMRAATEANQKAMRVLQEQGLAQSAEGKALAASIQQQMLDLRKAQEANKPETYSYAQKKEFDVLTRAKEEASKADNMSSVALRAAPLLQQAYGGRIEAGIKGLAGAVGIGSEAKDANDRLATLSQSLALNTPKFSGPTSDADAKRYDKAVGDLANPAVSLAAKEAAIKDIQYLSQKAKAYAEQAENYFFENNKSLRGFKFIAPPDPFAQPANNPYRR
jgi:hypothetical protein